ncbi:MAG: hypothetical protein V4722_12455 [Bacteroidota bacterium]
MNFSTAYIMRSTLVLFAVLLLATNTSSLYAQTTWTGNLNNDWNNAGNWSAGVPSAADDVTIPSTTKDPGISVAGAVAKSVTVLVDGRLAVSFAGTLTINGATTQGILNQGIIVNSGSIIVGNTSAVGPTGIRNEYLITNQFGGQIQVERATATGIYLTATAFINNDGTIGVGATVASGSTGIYNAGAFTNNEAGQVYIDRVSEGLENTGTTGLFNNFGTLSIGSKVGGSNIPYGISNHAPFNNKTTGQVHINRVTKGINTGTSTFNNDGTVTIGALTSVTELISADETGMFNNKTAGTFNGTGMIAAARFTNIGGTLSPGYSPGKITFNASENFDSSMMEIEVNGTGTAGVNYDQVAVTGTATLGGKLAVSVNYTPANGNQVTIVSATAISGTFSSVTGLPAFWRVTYTATAVILVYDLTNTWTGAISNNWSTAGNWSAGTVPTATINVVIPNVTNDPIITTTGAVARTIHVKPGASLTLNATGNLTTSGVQNFNGVNAGLYNQGTVTIKGPLMVKPN